MGKSKCTCPECGQQLELTRMQISHDDDNPACSLLFVCKNVTAHTSERFYSITEQMVGTDINTRYDRILNLARGFLLDTKEVTA